MEFSHPHEYTEVELLDTVYKLGKHCQLPLLGICASFSFCQQSARGPTATLVLGVPELSYFCQCDVESGISVYLSDHLFISLKSSFIF